LKADGLLCIGKFSDKEVKFFKDTCPNTVFLDMETKDAVTSCISMNFADAVNDALDFFVKKGHKKIAYLGGQEYVGDKEALKDQRESAYEEYMKNHKLAYKDLMRKGAFTSASGYEMMNSLIDDKADFTAVFAASDAIAIGAMRSASEHGLSIPEDVALIGFNDLEACRFSTPALSSIHAPAYEMGEAGANIVYNASRLKSNIPMKIKLPCEIVIRESC
ncbi:MAG: substrate-binding domain-containing protein, partial [Lachnospiraceae bacterium]|nr:substrate-binding domain-containing protein [Lachnospiraceae bacterium]